MADGDLRVGLIGFGNIGSGVVRTLAENRALIRSRLPRGVSVVRVADLDATTRRDAPYDPSIVTADAGAILDASDIDVVLELMGGVEPARSFAERAIRSGKHFVTANKAMLALHGPELRALAAEKGVAILFEAAVGGGIPIIRSLQQGLCANELTSIQGIINGTANYILTRMDQDGLAFDAALAEAQRLGYAEPDPTYDVEGHDTAHKIAILASLAFGMDIRFEHVWREGIRAIQPLDLKLARELGYAVKLLGIARREGGAGAAEVRVHPTLVPRESELAGVSGVFNAIQVVGRPIGRTVYVGRGAGADATSSAVVSDLMAIAAQGAGAAAGSGAFLAGIDGRLPVKPGERFLRPIEDLRTHYYLRFLLADRPGVVARLAQCLSDHGISIESMIQHRTDETDARATLTIVTHMAREGDVRTCLATLDALETTLAPTFVLRVEE